MQRVGKYMIPDHPKAVISDLEDTIIFPGEGERIKKRHLIRPLLTNPSWEKLSAAYFLITKGETCSGEEKIGALLKICEGMYQDRLYAAGREMAESIDPEVEEIFLRSPGARKAVVSMNTIQEARAVVDRMNLNGCGIGTLVANYVNVDSKGRLNGKMGSASRGMRGMDGEAIDGGDRKCYAIKQVLTDWNVADTDMKDAVYVTDGSWQEGPAIKYLQEKGVCVVPVSGGKKPGLLSRYSSIMSLAGSIF
jgi:hypothetical protein